MCRNTGTWRQARVKGQVFFCLAAFFSFPAFAEVQGLPDNVVELTSPEDLALLKELNDAKDNVTNRVTPCVDSGKPPAECHCENVDVLKNLDQTLRNVLAQRPSWDRDIVLFVAEWEDEGSLNLSVPGIRNSVRNRLEQCKQVQ